ncbi:trichome birefringence-like protein 34 [Tanacetum coccineum]
MKGDQNCLNETEPVKKDEFWESGSDLRMLRILESSLNRLKARGVNVHMMNVSQMTQYRKDAHPSIHRISFKKNERLECTIGTTEDIQPVSLVREEIEEAQPTLVTDVTNDDGEEEEFEDYDDDSSDYIDLYSSNHSSDDDA